MTTTKTQDLAGAALDWAVAKALSHQPVLVIGGVVYDKWAIDYDCDGDNSLRYSTSEVNMLLSHE